MKPAAKAPGTRIGRSVMPTKREIICPECGFRTEIAGKLSLVVCQQCRHRVKVEDKTVKGAFSDEIETGGIITIEEDAVLEPGAKLTGNDVMLRGKMKGGEIRACRRLILSERAEPDWKKIRFLDLQVEAGVELASETPIEGRHVEVLGLVRGELKLEGTLTIRPGGDVHGSLRAAGLELDDGGGITAQVDVNPDYAPEPEPRKPQRKPAAKKAAAKKAPVKKTSTRSAPVKKAPAKKAGPKPSSDDRKKGES